MTPPGDLCLKNLLNMPPLMVKGCEMRLDLSTGLTEESHTLPVVAYTAVPNKGRRDLFFFCFFFSFQQRKKEEHLLVSISHRKAKEKQAQQTLYQSKNHPQNKHPEYQHSTYKKRQTKAFASPRRTARETSDSAERVSGVRPRIIVYRNRKGIAGRTMFAPTVIVLEKSPLKRGMSA